MQPPWLRWTRALSWQGPRQAGRGSSGKQLDPRGLGPVLAGSLQVPLTWVQESLPARPPDHGTALGRLGFAFPFTHQMPAPCSDGSSCADHVRSTCCWPPAASTCPAHTSDVTPRSARHTSQTLTPTQCSSQKRGQPPVAPTPLPPPPGFCHSSGIRSQTLPPKYSGTGTPPAAPHPAALPGTAFTWTRLLGPSSPGPFVHRAALPLLRAPLLAPEEQGSWSSWTAGHSAGGLWQAMPPSPAPLPTAALYGPQHL